MELLDRVIVNHAWHQHFHLTHVNHLSRTGSDHCPLLVTVELLAPSTSPKPFKFLPMWTLHSGFKTVAGEVWEAEDHGDGMYILHKKL